MKTPGLFLALSVLLVMCSSSLTSAQVRFTEVNVSARTVEITNFGTASVSLTGWRFCHRFTYPSLSGSIAAGESRQFSVTFDQTSSDLCLYTSSSFSSAAAMEDFIQWGAGSLGRSGVADSKGIWPAASFLPVPAAGVSFHARAQPTGTTSRVGNWFTGLPHAGFPVPAPALESAALQSGTWTLVVSSHYLPAALIPETNAALSGVWSPAPAPVRTDLGSGRVRITLPAGTGPRQFLRVRAQP